MNLTDLCLQLDRQLAARSVRIDACEVECSYDEDDGCAHYIVTLPSGEMLGASTDLSAEQSEAFSQDLHELALRIVLGVSEALRDACGRQNRGG